MQHQRMRIVTRRAEHLPVEVAERERVAGSSVPVKPKRAQRWPVAPKVSAASSQARTASRFARGNQRAAAVSLLQRALPPQ